MKNLLRHVALVLSFAMILTAMPLNAFAEEVVPAETAAVTATEADQVSEETATEEAAAQETEETETEETETEETVAENEEEATEEAAEEEAEETVVTTVVTETVVTETVVANEAANEVVTGVAKIGETSYATFKEAINAVGAGDVVIELIGDATLDYNAREAFGTDATTSLTIKGNGKTLTLNQKNSDWSSFGLKNSDAETVFNNMTIEKTGYGDTSGAWNTHAIIFSTNVEMNDVVVNNAIAVEGGANLDNVTINEANEYYGLWIYGNGQSVTVTNSAINATNGGRGIKIADEYVDNAAKVQLTLEKTAFNTAKKAAVLVSSTAGAAVTATNVDISKVAADSTNIVWVDEDWAEYSDKVTVNGSNASLEGAVASVNGKEFLTLEAAIAAAKDGDEVKILEAGTYALSTSGKNITITGTVEGVVFDNIGGKNMGGANVTFNNVTFDYYPNTTYTGLQHSGNLVYNNCTINGQVFLYGTSETFNNCTFNQNSADAYNVWTYGAKKVTFDKCIFNSAGKSVLIYNESGSLFSDVTVTDCDFIASAPVDGKAAIEMDSSLTAGINLTIDDKTTVTRFGKGNVSGNSLWNNKNGNTGVNNDITVTVDGVVVLKPAIEVATKAELDKAIEDAKDGDIIRLTADIDYTGTASLEINKAVVVDLNEKTLTTHGTYGGLRLKGGCTLKNGTLVHKGTVTAIKAWDVAALEDLDIEVTGTGDASKTIGGIVLQENCAGIDVIKNVNIYGEGLTNGIETYNCGNATEPVIGSMENVTIDAKGTGMLISAPVGTATNCTISGDNTGIELWIKGTYSATLDLVDCDVKGGEIGIHAHDEFSSNPSIQNNGTLELTMDEDSTVTSESGLVVEETIARAENVDITDATEKAGNPVVAGGGTTRYYKDAATAAANTAAKIGDTAYETLEAAIAAAKDGDTVTLVADTTLAATATIDKAITLDLGGKTVTGKDGEVAFVVNADATIKNGTVKGNKSGTSDGLINIYADLAMNDVTVETTEINALRFKADNCTATLENCNVTGAFKGYGSSVWNIKSGTYKASSTAISDQLNGTAAISGGTFYYAIDEADCAPGYVTVDNGDGTWTVKYDPKLFVDADNDGVWDDGEKIYVNLDQLFANHKEGDVHVVITGDVVANGQVDTDADAHYYFTTNAADGVTMDFLYADNWNYIQNMTVGENVTLNANKYLCVWTELDLEGTINTGHAYLYGADVTVHEGAKLNVTTGSKTVQVKGGTTLTVNGTVNTSTLNVWAGNAELIVSGDNAQVNASWIDIWDGTPSVTVEDGATLNTDAIKASRGGSIAVDNATLDAGSIELGHNGNSAGKLTVTGDSYISNMVLTAKGSTVEGPAGMDVKTTYTEAGKDFIVAYDNGVYSVAEKSEIEDDEDFVCVGDELAMKEHPWGEWQLAASGDTRTCSNCGETETRKHQHAFGGWYTVKEPNCYNAGYEAHVCSVCNEAESRPLAATSHNYDINGVCAICGQTKASAPSRTNPNTGVHF